MQLEFHQLDRRWEHLRVREPHRQRHLLASLAESGQQAPIVVVVSKDNNERYLVIDGHKRIAALRQLGRDTVEATVWPMSEAEALLLSRSLRFSPQESALEQGWLLSEMERSFGYSLDELARRFDRSISWVSRRLALVELLRYENDEVSECTGCIFRAPVAEVGPVRALWGWYERDAGGTLWSRTMAAFECDRGERAAVWLRGELPAAPQSNLLEFRRGGQIIAVVRNDASEPLLFEVELAIDDSLPTSRLTAHVAHGFSPWRRGFSTDTRELGFALFGAELRGRSGATMLRRADPPAKPPSADDNRKAADLLFAMLAPLGRVAALQRSVPRIGIRRIPAGSLGVIVPKRGGPTLLASCLSALEAALAGISLPSEAFIVVNGSPTAEYAELVARFSGFHFIFSERPLGFTAAIRTGLKHVTAGWTYLLNSDVLLAQDALTRVIEHRAPHVFSLASAICSTGPGSAKETNRTGLELIDGLANLIELDGAAESAVEHYYSGGGSSLFQTA
jgi:ParB/RepB/Spo0J family partition protein